MRLAVPGSAYAAGAPTIASDQADYGPGDLVTLTGTNWQPGESVHIDVDDAAGQTWSWSDDVTADDTGTITDQFNLPDWFVASYSVTATGPISGTATTSFTDSVYMVWLASVDQANPPPTSFTVYYTRYTTRSDCTGTSNATSATSSSGAVTINIGGGKSILVTGATATGYTLNYFSGDGNSTVPITPSCAQGSGGQNLAGHAYAHFKFSDTTPPVITFNQSPNGTNGWFKSSPAKVTVTATDPSGVTSLACTLDNTAVTLTNTGSTSTTMVGDVTTSTEGTHTVACQAVDGANNTATYANNTTSLKLDTLAPTSLTVSPAGGTYNAGKSVSLSATDVTSGVAALYYTTDGSTPGTGSTPYTGPISIGANTTLKFIAVDNAGNSSGVDTESYTIDSTAPSLTVTHTADGQNGWNVHSSVTVTVAASDANSGLNGSPTCTVGGSPLSLSGGAGTWTASVSGDGSHSISCSVSDTAGNSTTAGDTVKIDTVAPSLTVGLNRTPDHGTWYNHPVGYSVTAGSDTGSGIASCDSAGTYSGPDSATASASLTCSDVAGNVGSGSVSFQYDATAPAITDLGATSSPNSNNWFNHDVTDTFSVSDSVSGLDSSCTSTFAYDSNSGKNVESKTTSGEGTALTVTSDGCADNAGNVASGLQSSSFKVDKTAPSVTVTLGRAFDHNGWYSHAVGYSVAGNFDATSGVAFCDSGATYSGPDSATASASLTCTDLAGNVGSGSVSFKYDATAPTGVTTTLGRDSDTNGWYNHPVSWTTTGNDATSGVDSCSSGTYSGPDGSSVTVSGTCTDQAGNTSSSATPAAFKYDATAPVISDLGATSNANSNGWYNHDVTDRFAASDGVSGLSSACTSAFQLDPSSGKYTESKTTSGEGAALTVTSDSCTDNAGNPASGIQSSSFKVDKTAPSVDCSARPDASKWYGANQSFSCTVSDSLSGVTHSGPASPALSTTVAGGVETASAQTNSVTVYDDAGNSATAGPYTYKIDLKAPSISLTAPVTNGMYTLNQKVTAAYSCNDGGSGVASCTGTVSNGATIDTSGVGSKTFTVNATDNVGNKSATQSVSYNVGYASTGTCNGDTGHQILQPINADGTSVWKSGSTVPAKFRVCDANGVSIGTPGLVTSFKLIQTIVGTTVSNVDETPVSTTPDTAFRWDSTNQQWIYNISTKGMTVNTTYVYLITLNDGSTIQFQFGLK
jgi:hypothetical protein